MPRPGSFFPQTIYSHWNGNGTWQVRVTPHLRPLYRIEGEAQRRAEGIYDKMRGLGAHEVVVESPKHDASLSLHLRDGQTPVGRAFNCVPGHSISQGADMNASAIGMDSKGLAAGPERGVKPGLGNLSRHPQWKVRSHLATGS